jgi:hypothetical protein
MFYRNEPTDGSDPGAQILLDPTPRIGPEPEPDPHDSGPPRRGALIALLFIVLLIVGALFIEHVLSTESKLQDCVMQGRTNCAPIDADTSNR